jgi:glycosyltransferase involved in cell wall biosynthesis
MRIAIVHDDFMQWGGAERLVASLASIFPDASVYTPMLDEKVVEKSGIASGRFVTSWMDKLPFKRIANKALFSLYPLVFESYDFSDYDVVISSSARFAHGVITKPHTKHFAFINSPFRGFWDPYSYFGTSFRGQLLRKMLSPELLRLRGWDFVAGQRADVIFGNSGEIVKRIRKYYRREAEVFYPFVDFDRFNVSEKPQIELPDRYFVVISRLVEWKRIDIAIEACNAIEAHLVVIGAGPYLESLRKIAGKTVSFTGYTSEAQTTYILKNAEALIHPQREDFGMTVVEANYCKTPVIAYGAGGALETVIEGETGVFFRDQSAASLTEIIKNFAKDRFSPERMSSNAERFSRKVFEDRWKEYVYSHH